MKKSIFTFLIFLILSCNSKEEESNVLGDCVVPAKPDVICTKDYKPVCACNDIVYSNSCEAEKAGNLKWKSTEKDSGETCSF
ncbi:Kazal-type serine protease inhibitor [Flavobacteriaceae bacterium]|jgi:hypothetical protein|nr:Kazal-type serine protease inhibitor [Flavobacteriaceae bacterium]|tara:strand:- start:511 stop:756 length:246 start_codon:yes stop_codon:yes gene_type:complete